MTFRRFVSCIIRRSVVILVLPAALPLEGASPTDVSRQNNFVHPCIAGQDNSSISPCGLMQ